MKKYYVTIEEGIYYLLDSEEYPNDYNNAVFASDSFFECGEYIVANSPEDLTFTPGFEI